MPKLKLRKSVSSSTGTVKETRKANGKVTSEKVQSIDFEEVAEGGWTGNVTCTIRVGFVHPKNYNSAQVEVGATIPFAVPAGSSIRESLDVYDVAFAKLWDKVDALSDEKAAVALDALGLGTDDK